MRMVQFKYTNLPAKKFICAGIFCLFLAGSAWAQSRVATVNMEILFNQYWKTGLIRAALKEKAKAFDQTDQQMAEDLQKANDKYQKLLDDSTNQALSPAQCADYRREAADQLQRAKQLEYNLTSFEQQARATLAEQRSRARKDILSDISEAVSSVAKAKGYSLVLHANPQGAETDSDSLVLYSDGSNNLTQSVLRQLNAGAPANTSSGDTDSGTDD